MWCPLTLGAEHDYAMRYGAFHQRSTDGLKNHAETTPQASPNHPSSHPGALAARQSLDLETEASALVSGSLPKGTLERYPILLPAHCPAHLETSEGNQGRLMHRTPNLDLRTLAHLIPPIEK